MNRLSSREKNWKISSGDCEMTRRRCKFDLNRDGKVQNVRADRNDREKGVSNEPAFS